MSETRFTPGEWESVLVAEPHAIPHWIIQNAFRIPVAIAYMQKDADLFAAAPDLYAACEAALVELQFYTDSEAAPKLEAALKKARGK